MNSSRKKIGVIMSGVSGRGGMETVLEKILDSTLLKKSFSFSVILKDPVKYADFLTIISKKSNLFYFGTKRRLLSQLCLLKYLLFTKADILIMTGPKSIYLAYLVRLVFFKKYLILSWMHFSITDIKIDKNKLRYADFHLAIAEGIREQLINLGIDPRKVFLIYNPVEKRRDKIKKCSGNTTKLVYIGRVMLAGQKNMKILIDALSIAQTHIKVSLDVYGSGPSISRVMDYAHQRILDDSVTINWHGWSDKPWTLISEADALVMTSNYEGFGMVIAESISRGLVAIAPDILGPNEIIVNNKNGFLYKANNLEDLVNKILIVRDFSRSINYASVKKTITKFYEEEYFKNLNKILLRIIQ
ncbi:glycosyltransferase [Oenococcus oeni]|uniref:glycosyltransferase n=1 Tax=Oenococcus oeni TaxID=1247 RepID=UPI0009B14F63|nr:glycosyltransferase [Oenococcus oeni]